MPIQDPVPTVLNQKNAGVLPLGMAGGQGCENKAVRQFYRIEIRQGRIRHIGILVGPRGLHHPGNTVIAVQAERRRILAEMAEHPVLTHIQLAHVEMVAVGMGDHQIGDRTEIQSQLEGQGVNIGRKID